MKKNTNILLIISFFLVSGIIAVSCKKDEIPGSKSVTPVTTSNGSFKEGFEDAGTLTSKGWAFKNNSNPPGQYGWRQGRYEATAQQQYKFLAPVPYIGYPAHTANNAPNEFISADATVVNDAATGSGNISAWLISPTVPLSNGDKITFWTRAMDDRPFAAYAKDRMQVRANYIDGSAFVGSSDLDTGNFKVVLLDINPTYDYNDPAGSASGLPGYPWDWTKYTITISGVPGGSIAAGRFAFRYFGRNAGVFGGTGGTNYPTVVGIDDLEFVHN